MRIALYAALVAAFAGAASAQSAAVVFSPDAGSNIVVARNGSPTYVISRVTRPGLPKNDITSMWTASAPSGCTASVPYLTDQGNGVLGIVSITCTAGATPGYYSFNASAYGLDNATAPPTGLSGYQSWYLQVTN